jgi:hypothetical protein
MRRLPAGGEGKVESDRCPVTIGVGGDDVGELTSDPQPVATVGLVGRPAVAGIGVTDNVRPI